MLIGIGDGKAETAAQVGTVNGIDSTIE